MPTDPHDLKEGDQVSWKWGAGHPKGEVLEVSDEGVEATTKRGNVINKGGSEENPGVKIKAASGSEAVKRASELDGVKPTKS